MQGGRRIAGNHEDHVHSHVLNAMDFDAKVPAWERISLGIRRLGRPAQRRANWQYLPLYWRLRERFHQFSFRALRMRHGLIGKHQESVESVRSAVKILRLISSSLLLAIFLVATIASAEVATRRFFVAVDASLPNWPWLAFLIGWVGALRLDAAAAASLLAALAQIACVFLGLYFAVVGTLLSARYSDVPPNVRELMFADKLGNQYVGLVALFGAVAILTLSAQSVGFHIGLLSVVFVAFLGTATVLSFVRIGRRAFEFFDPSPLASQLAVDLVDWIDQATRAQSFGRNPSFQDHYRKQAAGLLASYQDIVRVAAADRSACSSTMPKLADQMRRILAYYVSRKHRLASDSYWFHRRYEHKDWLIAGFNETSMALKTGRALEPRKVPDVLWFEREAVKAFWSAYDALLRDEHLEEALRVSRFACDAMTRFGEYMLVDEAVEFASTWKPFARQQSKKTVVDEEMSSEQERELLMRLAIVDAYSQGVIELLLSVATSTADEIGERLRTELSDSDWRPTRLNYQPNAPRPVVVELERLRSQIDFERQAEGTSVTATWYMRQRIAFAYCTWYRDAVETILAQFESAFGDDLDALTEDGRWLAAASLSSRATEGCSKFRYNINRLRASNDKWLAWRGHAEVDWPNVDWDAVAARLTKLEERIQKDRAGMLAPLLRYQLRGSSPDYFGEALATSLQACFDALRLGYRERFMSLFPAVFTAAIAASDRVRAKLKNQSPEVLVAFSTDPVVDLMELSGYALVYYELGTKEPWSVAKETWVGYFATTARPAIVGTWLVNVMRARSSGLSSPGDLRRSEWKRSFMDEMQECGLLEDPWSRTPWSTDSPRAHGSPLVRALLRDSFMISDLADVFLVRFLAQQPFGKDVAATTSMERFRDEYHREVDREAGNSGDEADQ